MIKDLKYHALLHVIIFIWGFTGILGKLIHLDAYPLVWHRTWIGFTGLAIALVFLKKSLRVGSLKQLLSIAGVGVIVALHWMTFYKSIQLSTASLGILCLSTTTLHVTWLEPLLFRKKFSWIEFFLGLAVVYGIYFVSDEFNEKEYEALAYGLSSAFFAALFSVLNGQLARRIPAHTISLYELISAFLFLTIFLFFKGKSTEIYSPCAPKISCGCSSLVWCVPRLPFLVRLRLCGDWGLLPCRCPSIWSPCIPFCLPFLSCTKTPNSASIFILVRR